MNLSYVQLILKNENYKGDLLLHKSYTADFLTYKRVKNTINNYQIPMYYVANAVSREMLNKAKEIRSMRFYSQRDSNQNTAKYFKNILILECLCVYNVVLNLKEDIGIMTMLHKK